MWDLVVVSTLPELIVTGELSENCADALTPCIARSSTAMILTARDKQGPAFHEKGFQIYLLLYLYLYINDENIYVSLFGKNKDHGGISI